MIIIDKHLCKTCNKSYSSYSSLWNHNKNIHKTNVSECIPEVFICNQNVNNLEKLHKCKYCNNNYSTRQNKWKHEQKCQVIFEEKEQQNKEVKIAEINSNKEIKLAQIELEKINANKEIKLAEINKEIELKKLEIKKENSIIKHKTNRNPTIKNINKLLQNRINMNNS
jgi:hypothetical protein